MEGLSKFEEAQKCCEFFLKTFNPDSSARVSKDRFMEVMRELKKLLISPTCLREHNHPIPFPVLISVKPNAVLSVFMDMRDDSLSCMFTLRQQSGDIVDRLLNDTVNILGQRPEKTDLEALEAIGVKPFDIVKYMNDRFNESSFAVLVGKATQEPALA